MNCARFWCSVVAVYAVIGILASLSVGEPGVAACFGGALVISLTVIAETWPEPGEETDE